MFKYILLLLLFLLIKNVNVFSQTSAVFETNFSKICVGGSINFINNSTGSINSSNWDFGDGTISTLNGKQNTIHTFTNPGKYEVELTIISTTGSSFEFSKIIEVIPTPSVSFLIEGNKCEVPSNLTIVNTSTLSDGINYIWSFGNGQSSNLYSPGTVTYSSSGKYNVLLKMDSKLPGCISQSKTNSVQIYDFSATISGNDLFCAKVGTKLIAKSTMPVDSYSWNLGDGNVGANNDTIFYEYPKAGSYVVDLKIVNSSIQCESHAYYKVTSKPIPTPIFSVNTTKICPGFSVNFTNNSASLSDYVWNFGDGVIYNGKDPGSHLYQLEGKKTVTLSAKSSNGCFGTSEYINLIEVFNPVVKIKSDTNSGCSILPVKFEDLSESNDKINNPIIDWEWQFSNGNTFKGQAPPIQLFDVGLYDVILKINTSKGCVVEQKFKEFIKVGKIDKVDFISNQSSGCANKLLSFQNNSLIKSKHNSAELSFNWIFSDSTTDKGETITHSFNRDTGMVSVKFYIHFRGCSDSITKNNVVRIKPPLAKFEPDTLLFCFDTINLPYIINNKFIDLSKLGKKGDQIDEEWTFGNGKVGFVGNIDPLSLSKGSTSNSYNDFGTYKVVQKITNHTTSCTDTTSRLFHISWVKPSFSINVDSVCQFSSINISDKSTSYINHPLVDYSFNTGEGTSLKGKNQNYSYKSFGEINVINHPINSVGCTTSSIEKLTVIKIPDANVQSDVDSSCAPGTITYSNMSKIQGNSLPYSKFYWFLPQKNKIDSTSNIKDFKIESYYVTGYHYVTLKAKDIFGCNSKIDTAWVYLSKPVSKIDYQPFVCNNIDFKIFNQTKNWVKNTWMIDGDFIGKDKDTIIYQFNDSKNELSKSHKLVLISLDKKKCIDTLERDIIVSIPKAKFDYKFQNLVDTTEQTIEFKCPPLFSNYYNKSVSIGKIDSSKWEFTKNSKSILNNPIKIYTKPGVYSTYLRIIDQYGCTDDTLLFDFMKINGPKGYPIWSGMGDVCGQYYKFELKNIEKVSKISWDLGDGTIIPDSVSLKHRYPEISKYKPTVTLTDFEDCRVTYLMEEPDTLIVIPETGMNADFGVSSYEIKLGQTLYLNDLSISPLQPIIKYEWNYNFPDSNMVDSSFVSEQKGVKYSKYGTKNILLKITDKDNCSDQKIVSINVLKDLDMPNVFTPNFDGMNDNFELFDSIFKTYDIYVFNRWGNKVFEETNKTGTFLWDGSNKNKTELENGVYFYNLFGTFEDGTILNKQGGVTIFKD
jgi:gliding motility-associated-like protein